MIFYYYVISVCGGRVAVHLAWRWRQQHLAKLYKQKLSLFHQKSRRTNGRASSDQLICAAVYTSPRAKWGVKAALIKSISAASTRSIQPREFSHHGGLFHRSSYALNFPFFSYNISKKGAVYDHSVVSGKFPPRNRRVVVGFWVGVERPLFHLGAVQKWVTPFCMLLMGKWIKRSCWLCTKVIRLERER